MFSLGRYNVHSSATLACEEPLTVITSPDRWAYAISFPHEPTSSEHGWDGVIKVSMRVLDGEVSILALAADDGVIDEVFVGASERCGDLFVVSTPLEACDRVVIRQSADNGVPSKVEIVSIQCEVLGEVEQGPRLSAPDNLSLRPVAHWSGYYGGRGQSLSERVRSARYATLQATKPMPWLEDLELLIQPNEELSRAVYISGTYEPATLLVLRSLLPRGGVFLDVGANVGLYSLLASRWVGDSGHVVAFEPSPREFARLRAHIDLNRLANVRVIQQAVTDATGWVKLGVMSLPHAGHNTTLVDSVADGAGMDSISRVGAITLDDFVSDAAFERVDAVKVDVEGAELTVLEGARTVVSRFRPSWIIELSAPTAPSETSESGRILRYLQSTAHELYRLDPSETGFSRLTGDETAPRGNLVAIPRERGAPVHMEATLR